jgi:transketolase
MKAAATEVFDCRQSFTDALIGVASTDLRVVVVVNDSLGSSNLDDFAARFPERVVNVGIAEQAMIGVAAGLAASGRVPFVSGAACFLTGRATEQLKVDVAYSRNNVKIIGQAPGMAYGELGPTHHSIEDFSWLRAMPGMTILAPADPVETAAAVRWAASYDGPVYMRVSRLKVPAIFGVDYEFTPGKGRIVRQGDDVTIIANGVLLTRALGAADLLAAHGLSAQVVSMPTVKPLDDDLVLACAARSGHIVTVEEALVSGGLGAAVASLVVAHRPVPMRIVGVPDQLAPTGSEAWLLDHFGMSVAGIAKAAAELVE